MNTYRYKPYYHYNGPSIGDPLRERLTHDNEERNIELFYADVLSTFEADEAVITRDDEGVVSIQTYLPKQDCDARVAQLLINLDLFGSKL